MMKNNKEWPDNSPMTEICQKSTANTRKSSKLLENVKKVTEMTKIVVKMSKMSSKLIEGQIGKTVKAAKWLN